MNPYYHKTRDYKTNQAHHIVLKCQYTVFSQGRVRQIADSVLQKYGEHFRVKIYHRAIVGNHIHLLVLPHKKSGLHGFLRVIAGQMGMKLKRLGIIPKGKAFWVSRPWSRLLTWGRNFTTAVRYIALNYLEGQGRVRRTHKRDETSKMKKLIDGVIAEKLTKLDANPPDAQLVMKIAFQ